MKAHYRTRDGRMTFELDGDQKQLFEGRAKIQEVFEADTSCGVCHSPDIKFAVREVDANKYFEMHCLNSECRARLSFGQHKTGGTLFPKRKDESGWLPNHGWVKYQPKGDAYES